MSTRAAAAYVVFTIVAVVGAWSAGRFVSSYARPAATNVIGTFEGICCAHDAIGKGIKIARAAYASVDRAIVVVVACKTQARITAIKSSRSS